MPILTSIMELFVLIYVFQFWKSLSKARKERRMKISIIPTALCFLIYFWLFSAFVFNAPDVSHRDVKGLVHTEAARSVISKEYPEQEALKGAAYDPELIWEPWTVNLMRVLLLVTWLSFFAAISIFLATFVLLKQKTE